jgi:hypothetical protein
MSEVLEEVVLTPEQKNILEQLFSQYQQACEEFNVVEAKKKALNGVIKQMLSDLSLKKYYSENLKATMTISVRPNISWDEDALLCYCKTLQVPGLVKQKDYVDMDCLESCLYRGEVEAKNISKFQNKKPDIVTLKVTQKQKLTE